MRDEDGGNLRSVRRAVTALELIAEAGELGVSELGRRLDVHKATASRLVSTLAERGLLERDPVNERYRLGFGLVRLAGAAMAGLDIVREAHPVLESLAERTRETVNLGVISGDSVVYIDQVAGTRSVISVSNGNLVQIANVISPNRSSGWPSGRSWIPRCSGPSSTRSFGRGTRRRSRSSRKD